MNALVNEQKGQPLAVGNSNTTLNSNVPAELETLTVNIFFDGTGNNMFNTEACLENKHTNLKGQVSYNNYYSNVALLYMAAKRIQNVQEPLYIEGSGTFKYKEDETKGLGFSWGDSGINKRVKKAFEGLQLLVETANPQKLVLNVFGFSRGSFFARYFCAMSKIEPAQRIGGYGEYTGEYDYYGTAADCGRGNLSLFPKDININFVGLFDTVSSEGGDHYNDAKAFHLNIGTKEQAIGQVFHLTAQNEYRYHFPLTRINTAARASGCRCGFECSLPGAHSNIGGSYVDYVQEEERYLSTYDETGVWETLSAWPGEIYWEWFFNKGYYYGAVTPTAGTYGDFIVKNPNAITGVTKRVFGQREKPVRNTYQFLPLKIMKSIAELKMGGHSFDLTIKKGEELQAKLNQLNSLSSNSVLGKLRDYAENYVKSNFIAHNGFGLDFKIDLNTVYGTHNRGKGEARDLYNQYIHNSLDPLSIKGNRGSWLKQEGGEPLRIIINDNA